jgi:MFS family permease
MDSRPMILISARGLRAFGDGFTALLLPVYLVSLGFTPLQVGVLTAATLAGSAALTFAVGHIGHRIAARRLLLACCGLMLATGVAFSQLHAFWPLVLTGFLGTLNPSGGDVSAFLPIEHALLAQSGSVERRTTLFALYSLAGVLMAAVGALSLGALEPIARHSGASMATLMKTGFALYGCIGILAFALYLRLPAVSLEAAPQAPLGPSRRRVLQLAALFSLDAFGGGFLVQSLLALWLFQRFDLSLATAGALFFWWGLLAAVSQLAAPPMSRRIGLINTMVFTHIPANACAIAAAFAPNLASALVLLSVRALLSSMDVPARTSYVMAVVTPAERAAAAALTNIPRSLAAAASPSLAGVLLSTTLFAWPLVLRGGLGIAYDLILWRMFRRVKPLDEGLLSPEESSDALVAVPSPDAR